MDIVFVNRLFLFESVFFILIGLGALAIPIIRWLKWRKNERANGYERYNGFSDWADDHPFCIFGFSLICVTAFAISACLIGINATKAYENRIEEPSRYEYAIIQQKTISDAFEKTTDVVNTDLYLKAVNYNSNLSEFKTKFNDPRFAVNFTGDYNWNALEYIELK